MGKVNQALLAFNRGIISKFGLARIDVTKVALSASQQTNWLPRLLGSMMLRPGLKYVGGIKDDEQAIFIPFIFSKTQTALLEFTNNSIRVWKDDKILTRNSVGATITNGNFEFDLADWANNDETGATSEWIAGSYMKLVGTGIKYARRTQFVNTSTPDTEHSIKIVIKRGPVQFKIGLTSDSDDIFEETTLQTGTHSLVFTPSASFYINFYSLLQREILVESVEIEGAGDLVLPSPYTTAQLPLIRFDQSLDVIFLAGGSIQQRELQRRGNGKSWSIILYETEDGPVRVQNTSEIALTASAISGNITVSSNSPVFKSGHVGSVWKLISVGQNVIQAISSDNTFTDHIIVRGIGETRKFAINITGTWTATITLQRSFDEGTSWESANTWTGNVTTTFDDGLDNQIVWYRIGIETGDYTSGTANVSLSYSLGSITGYFRITGFTSDILVSAEVLKDLGSTNPTTQWSEAQWSDYRGFPSALALTEGRLAFAGQGKIVASISDAYRNFDDEVGGDSGFISRDLGAGAISNATWMTSLYRLFIGCDTSVKAVKTNSFEEPMTPTNFRVVEPSTQSCANVPPVKLDKKALFVQGAGTRLFELTYDQSTIDYAAQELTSAVPEIGQPSILRLGIQRQPDTIIHCIRGDGKIAVLLYDELENLKCWILFETDGEVEDVIVLPGDVEDYVYYAVKRTINGVTKRFLEKFAFQNECQGGTLNKQADSFIEYSGVATNIITGLDHLEGEEVIVWADGKDLSRNIDGVQTTYTVTSGSITLNENVENAIVGLPYQALYESSKLAYASSSPLGQKKKVNAIGLILINTHSKGIQYGTSGGEFDDLPNRNFNTGAINDYNYIYDYLDSSQVSLQGYWNTDSRLFLKAQAPRPCTISACELAITTHDKE